MSRPLVVVRPEPGCSATVAAALDLRLDARGYPLFAISPRAWELPDGPFDALLLGSANAVRHGGQGLAALRDRPAYVVGEATATAAREHGFAVAAVGRGGLQAVLDRIAAPLRLLRLAGDEHVPLRPPPGVTVETRIVYAAERLAMPTDLAGILRAGAVVALHSAAAARHFAHECDRLEVPRGGIALAALGPRIAGVAGAGWRACRAAHEPTEAALLALAADLCHTPPGREGR